jgi:putative endonuclease
MAAHNEYGHGAEQQAAELLEARGWRVLHRNWRFGHREIDIVARRGRTVAFVEVRARRSAGWGHPLETVGRRKRRLLETAARAWLARYGRPDDDYRFDVIWLLGTGRVEHEEGAWST